MPSALVKQRLSAYPVFEQGSPALDVLADAGFEREEAARMLRALASNGFYVAPQVPTNAMLMASMNAFGRMPTNPATVLRAVAKARRRWQAMGAVGTASVFTTRFCRDEDAKRKEAFLAREGALDLAQLEALLGPDLPRDHQDRVAQGIVSAAADETADAGSVPKG